MAKYDHAAIEAMWQERWRQSDAHRACDGSPPLQEGELEGVGSKKFYALVEFPYPSGDGLHVGHLRSYTAMDVIARKRRMEGWNVLYPMGWDAFGLPAENYAVKTGQHPRVTTAQNIANFRRQLEAMGFSFDWSREVNTTDPAYYKWTQWIFLKLLEHGLAYKARVPINWCPSCKIGLANEEAVGGVCDRCGGSVEQREKEQWMLRITKYADKLLVGLDTVDYIERAKTQQRNWIGRSEGALIKFQITSTKHQTNSKSQAPSTKQVVEVFTTRPDTLFGATYVVLAPEYGGISNLKSQISNGPEVEAYIAQAKQKTQIERSAEDRDKTGVELKGVKAVNPANGEEIPVWIADYVLGSYGTGAIMAVPAHDERDFAFATQHKLPIRQVVRKVGAPIRSYVMGADDITADNFAAIGVAVAEKTANGFYKVEIPRGRERAFEDLIVEKMTPGFWNEYVGDETIFLFKHKDGRVERLVLNAQHVERIDRLACEFNNESYNPNDPGNYINGALARNEWYRPLIVHSESGTLMNSGAFDGMRSEDAKRAITEKVGGKMTVTYKLRDWVFSRQRYWGEPIPIVFCAACAKDKGISNFKFQISNIGGVPHAIVPIPESQLPVTLPEVEKYQPTETGESPLANIVEWVNTKCPRCGGPAKRETDVMPNWAGSSWYYLAYAMHGALFGNVPHRDGDGDEIACVPEHTPPLTPPARKQGENHSRTRNDGKSAWSANALKYWLPVDWYNGGMEHTTLHLLYSRFWNLFLHDIGAVPVAEPYAKRTSHGMILAEDGEKMSKSRGNVVNPDAIVAQYGADTVRVYEMFIGPFDQAAPWSTNGLVGCRRFLDRVAAMVERVELKHQAPSIKHQTNSKNQIPNSKQACQSQDPLIHRTIKKVTEDIEGMRFNTAISALMECVNALGKRERIAFFDYMTLLTLLAPFAPHLCEELHAGLERASRQTQPPTPRRNLADSDAGGHASSSPSTVEGENQTHSIFSHPWPAYDPALIAEQEVDMVVQVNGKVRATIRVATDITEADAMARALAEPNVAKHLGGKQPTKVIFVAGRILNLVCG